MIYRALVAVDGTLASNRALQVACALADNFEASLGLLSVVQPDEITDEEITAAQHEGLLAEAETFSNVFDAYVSTSTRQDADRAARARMLASLVADTVIAEAKAFSSDTSFKAIKTFVSTGDPAKAILRCASENSADIIIMGHDQQSRLEGLLHGSVAKDVQSGANCPVLIYSQPKP